MLSKVIILNGLNANGLAKCYTILIFVSFDFFPFVWQLFELMYLHFSLFARPISTDIHIKVGFIWKQSDLWFSLRRTNTGKRKSAMKVDKRAISALIYRDNLTKIRKQYGKSREWNRVQLFTIIAFNRNVFRSRFRLTFFLCFFCMTS